MTAELDAAPRPALNAPVRDVPLRDVPVRDVPALGMPVGGMPVGGMPVGGMPVGGMPVGGMPVFGVIDLLLRDRAGMLARIRHGVGLAAILRTMIVTIAVTMAIVGAALGSYRGGLQIAFAAIKLPVVLLGTAALSAPALSSIGAALGRRSRLAADLTLVMAALAFGSLLLVACTPLVLLGRSIDLEYHRMILATVAMFAIAGGAALHMICRGVALEAGPGWRTAVAGLCVVFSLVGGQLAWALRPYLMRPRGPDVVFLRDVEGGLLDSVSGALRSALGIYDRDEAPLGERRP